MLKTSFKCRPSLLRSKIACDGESLSLSCLSPLKLAIVASKFTTSTANHFYCPSKESPSLQSPCNELPVTSQVIKLCNEKQKCSFLADPVSLAILTGVKVIKTEVVCHAKFSAIRTTYACADQTVFQSPFVIEKYSTTTTTSYKSIDRNKIQVPFSTISDVAITNQNKLKNTRNNQSVEAKPLEPNLTLMVGKRKDTNPTSQGFVSEVKYFFVSWIVHFINSFFQKCLNRGISLQETVSNILLVLSVCTTTCLSIILVAILYKLYQTYQPPSLPQYQSQDQSSNSLDTQLSLLDIPDSEHFQPILIPVQSRNSGRKQPDPSFTKSHTLPRLTRTSKDVRVMKLQNVIKVRTSQESSSVPASVKSLVNCEPGHSKKFNFHELDQEANVKPTFQNKWQFPRRRSETIDHKYLSL